MSHAPIEIVEEDAADLQFPKDDDNGGDFIQNITIDHNSILFDNSKTVFTIPEFIQNPTNTIYCDACFCILNEPYITCAECTTNQTDNNQIITNYSNENPLYRSCLKCFANGSETKIHSNTHAYIITHDNVKVFPNSNWSAREDRRLLELILQCGFANWSDISNAMITKTSNECRDHYFKYYFDGIFLRTCGLTKSPYSRLNVPYLFKTNTIEPPRHSLEMIHSKYMAGYRFARGDFDTPYDVSAESIVSYLELPKDWDSEYADIGDQLNCAVFRVYNNRLRERRRRYQIMREHGLILPNRTRSWLAKYSDALGIQNGKQVSVGRFLAFMQLTSAISFDKIVERLQYKHDLKKFIFKLYELRSNGIKTYQGGRIYNKLISHRTSKVRTKSTINWEWKQLAPDEHQQLSGTGQIIKHCLDLNNLPAKRKSTPLNIIGLPQYDKLNNDERQLCSQIRVIPDAYLIYKKILISENLKMGYLRLADARRLIKIDVNKTRVMYDFFFEYGFINKPFAK